jgi:hypothetical protein
MQIAPTLATSARISKTRRIRKEAKSYHANKTSFLVSQPKLIAQIELAAALFFEREKEIELAPQVQPECRQ